MEQYQQSTVKRRQIEVRSGRFILHFIWFEAAIMRAATRDTGYDEANAPQRKREDRAGKGEVRAG